MGSSVHPSVLQSKLDSSPRLSLNMERLSRSLDSNPNNSQIAFLTADFFQPIESYPNLDDLSATIIGRDHVNYCGSVFFQNMML